MTTSTIRQKLYDYIRDAEDSKVKDIYTMLIKDAEDEEYDRWNDEEFVAEMVKRSEDYKSGKDPGISWEDAKGYVRNAYANKKK